MKDIYVVVKDINTTITILSAAFDEDEAIIKADMNPLDFCNGEIDIIEKSHYGRIAVMTLYQDKYDGIIEGESIESILEISSLLELEDYNGEVVDVEINKVMSKLCDCDEKTEWINGLGLNNSNDTEDMFDIDNMIINK